MNPKIISIGTANPQEKFSQEEVYKLCGYKSPKIKSIFLNSDIDFRYFYLNQKDFKLNENVDEKNRRYLEGSLEISEKAINNCLEKIGCEKEEIDCLIIVSCTGYLCPGLSSHLVKKLNLRRDIQQANILGMGCGGALPGLQRAFDHAKAFPEQKILLVTVEICSAAYFIDNSLETIVGNAICADGAAAVLFSGNSGYKGPEILAFESLIAPEHLDKVGFEQVEGHLRIILHKDIPDLAGPFAQKVVDSLLCKNNLKKEDIKYWVLHSGGRKVIDKLKGQLNLSEEEIKYTKYILRNYGNMSSPTVLFVLKEVLEKANPQTGDLAIMLALGPGLVVETALLRW
ncbi:MAG TPA: type III polyketide synthase [candidate division Zixibacteria bacterium]|nr:type III polyketide synthase [candidate division Zixibacteria bacterium]